MQVVTTGRDACATVIADFLQGAKHELIIEEIESDHEFFRTIIDEPIEIESGEQAEIVKETRKSKNI